MFRANHNENAIAGQLDDLMAFVACNGIPSIRLEGFRLGVVFCLLGAILEALMPRR